MRKPDFARAADAARVLIMKYGYTNPPIDPEEIAVREGVRVSYAEFGISDNAEYSGFFRLTDNTIVVNEDIPDNRITFTIAHELAHFVLHQEYIRSQNYMPMPRLDEYRGPKPVEEIEADTFAANLLVPLFMLRKYLDIASQDELARLFFVSREVINYRIDLLRRHPNLAY